MDSWLDDFRKESSQNGLKTPPTKSEDHDILKIEDYGLK
jgi:hypothetical protein